MWPPRAQVYPETKAGYRLTAMITSDKYSKFLLGFVTHICTKAYSAKDTQKQDPDIIQVPVTKVTYVLPR